jgi:ssDNA-binding Zn-finger/Zn-ribbon topoisomerase 1
MEIKAGENTHIHCPECQEGEMIIRQNRQTDEFFLGCSRYPDCKHSQNLPEHLRLRALGQRGLFDDK